MSAGDHVNSRKTRKFVGEEEKKNFYLNEVQLSTSSNQYGFLDHMGQEN